LQTENKQTKMLEAISPVHLSLTVNRFTLFWTTSWCFKISLRNYSSWKSSSLRSRCLSAVHDLARDHDRQSKRWARRQWWPWIWHDEIKLAKLHISKISSAH
jgi:hypothetical protein